MAIFFARTRSLFQVANSKVLQKFLVPACRDWQCQQRRNLNVHEHISYQLLNEACIPTPRFFVAKTAKEAYEMAEKLETDNLVLKAQVLAGGRGVGRFKSGLRGGVKVVSSPEEAEKIAAKMLNQILVTKQTGPAGRICNKVMVTERKFPKREFYIAIMMERAFGGPVIIASSQGGVSIEDVAAETPEAIIYEPIDINCGLTQESAERVVEAVGLECESEETIKLLMDMYELFVTKDALLVEINPYAEDVNGGFFALDAKLRFDDSADYRQKELFALRDFSQEDPREAAAAKFNLNYIALDGNIGCMVNGAGLAMATMDIIKLFGGEPANFLDVGGGATVKAAAESIKIITSDPTVQAVLVNIFGGIIRCDIIAEGIITALKDMKVKVPIVVRLKGTNVDKAREMIASSGLKIIARDDLEEAAQLCVGLAEIVRLAKKHKVEVNFEMIKEEAGGKSCAAPPYRPPCDRAKEKSKCDGK